MRFSLLYGLPFRSWVRLLRQNRWRVAPRAWPEAAALTAITFANSLLCRLESRHLARRPGLRQPVDPPIFVLGIWRSGTTHLQRLLAQDPSLSYATVFQTMWPHSFLTGQRSLQKALAPFAPSRRLEDRMTLGFGEASEDEVALAVLSLCSPYLMWSFPANAPFYRRYVTLDICTRDEIDRWTSALRQFVERAWQVHRKPLILKSPAHTGRIRLILEVFPEARFVHIHRNPYRVFQSMRHLFRTWSCRQMRFQPWPVDISFDDEILDIYRTVYDAYTKDVGLIPPGHFHEIRYESLETRPLEELGSLYKALGMSGFEGAKPHFAKYLETVADYRKNRYGVLEEDIRRRVASSWAPYFSMWGYDPGVSS